MLLAAIAITGGLRVIFIFSSFTKLPLGDSTAILFSSPVIVMGLSVCLLKVSILINLVGISIFVENPKVCYDKPSS